MADLESADRAIPAAPRVLVQRPGKGKGQGQGLRRLRSIAIFCASIGTGLIFWQVCS